MDVRRFRSRGGATGASIMWLGCAMALCLGCASPPSAREPAAQVARTSTRAPRAGAASLEPSEAPKAIALFNVTALRSGNRTAGTLAVVSAFLPEGESVDDVEWLAVDGPSPLASPTRNVVFIKRRSTELRAVRGSQSWLEPVAEPSAPAAQELVRIQVRAPKKIIRVPFIELPEEVRELSVVADGREDGGVDFHLWERCIDTADATKAAAALEAMVARLDGAAARELTRGMFADAKVTVEGTDARLDVGANPEQVEALIELVTTLVRGL